MAATLTLDEKFLNDSLARYMPPNLPPVSVKIEEKALVISLAWSFAGLTFRPSAALRIVSFYWSDYIKTITFEMIKSRPLDARPMLAMAKPFLPDFIRTEDSFVTVDLLKIPSLAQVLVQPAVTDLDIIKMGVYEGFLSLTVDFKPFPA